MLNPFKTFNHAHWESQLQDLAQAYQSAEPFPHIVLERFIVEEALEKAHQEFLSQQSDAWIHYAHFNEKKRGLKKLEYFPPTIKALVHELNSEAFCRFLSQLTSIEGLLSDPLLEGGGMHESFRGGFLNIHADFGSHPYQAHWRRRVNVLIYLNEGWKDDYGGHLELWSRDMKARIKKIAPLFNRCVVFSTDATSYHGHPEPMTCPEHISRKSIALYYFTEEKKPLKVQSTQYRARPADGLKTILIWGDTQLIRAYTTLKRWTGLKDESVKKALKFFS